MSDDEPVTVVITRVVRAGLLGEYENALRAVTEAARGFPGHLGVTVLRPRNGERAHTLIFRFDNVAHLNAWESSRVRDEWVQRSNDLCETTTKQEASGIEAWFALPNGTTPRAPPKWKMAIVSFLVAFPTIQALNATLGKWRDLPNVLRGPLTGLAMIAFMTWVAMPIATRAFASWLFPRAER